MKLFEQEAGGVVEYDQAAAQKHMDECEAAIKVMEEEVKLLTGKENKKAQTEKKKAISAAKNDPKYIDAQKIVKGLEPKNGNFVKVKQEAKKVEKKEEKPVEEQEKECPGSTAKAGKDKGSSKKKGALSTEEQKEMEELKGQIEQYRERLVKEFGYSKKEIKADPEMCELEDKLKAFEKRA